MRRSCHRPPSRRLTLESPSGVVVSRVIELAVAVAERMADPEGTDVDPGPVVVSRKGESRPEDRVEFRSALAK